MTASSSEAPASDRHLLVEVDDGAVPVHLFVPAVGKGPGILLFQEIFGVTDYIRSRARDLADLGYTVAVPESYWRLGSPIFGDSMAGVAPAMEVAGQSSWERTVSDAVAATRALRDRVEVDGPTALMGFCFGGGVAWAAAASLADAGQTPHALVAYYGSQIPGQLDLAGSVSCPQLHHWGEADAFFPPETVTAVEQAVTAGPAEATFCRYDGANHAFDNPAPDFHHPGASASAWATTTEWLAEYLPVSSTH